MLKTLSNKFNNANPYIQYAILGGGIYLTYKIYKIMFTTEQEQSVKNIETNATKELTTYLANTKLSYPLSQYDQFANIIYNSTMYGLGDNYGAVRDTLKLMKNNADVAKLVLAYGSRQNYVFGIPQGPKRDLFTNIQAELGDEYFGLYSAKLNDIRADWAKKKITYKI